MKTNETAKHTPETIWHLTLACRAALWHATEGREGEATKKLQSDRGLILFLRACLAKAEGK